MQLLEGLNEAQKAAVLHDEGALLIVAGPGSGKTRTITHRIAYAISPAGRNLKADRILGITFTNKAADEMKQRIAQILPRSRKRPEISTYHAFCARLLRSNPANGYTDPTFTILDSDDQNQMVKTVMETLGLSQFRRESRTLLGIISDAKKAGIPPEEYPGRNPSDMGDFTPEKLREVYAGYEELIHGQNCLDFDDLLIYAVKVLDHDRKIRAKYNRRYKEIVVDEFQDTDQIQYQLVDLLSDGHRNVCVVGDPDQTIYEWRGAAAGNLTKFKQEFGATLISLGQNYRSTKSIVAKSANLISYNEAREHINLFTENEDGERVKVTTAGDREEEARMILEEICGLIRKGWDPSEIAVLYRNNSQSRLLELECGRQRVPYQILSGTPFWSRREIKDILAYMILMLNPGNRIACRRAMAVPPKGIGSKTVERIQQYAERSGCNLIQSASILSKGQMAASEEEQPELLSSGVRKKVEQFLDGQIQLKRLSQERPASQLIRYLIATAGLEEYIKGSDNPEERWANVEELIAAAQEYDRQEPPEGITALLTMASLDTRTRGQDQPGAITLSTVHKAKGMEWGAVFVAGLDEGTLPSNRSISEGKIEEERRVCYVAMTRAKKHLSLFRNEVIRTWDSAYIEGEPSRFIAEAERAKGVDGIR